jgi:ribonuclease BN (tRNA processing enzyme)
VKFYELKRRLLDFPGFRVIWSKVIHNQESVGYRFEVGGKIVVFSGDSGYCQDLIRLCKDADLAVVECAHADAAAVKGHLSPSLAAQIAEKAGVKKAVFNHFYPDVLENDPAVILKKYYHGQIMIARDGDEVAIPLG